MNEAAALAIEAPAKVNLGLRVCGRRADGYHLIESLFVPLELADRPAPALAGIAFGCASAGMGAPSSSG